MHRHRIPVAQDHLSTDDSGVVDGARITELSRRCRHREVEQIRLGCLDHCGDRRRIGVAQHVGDDVGGAIGGPFRFDPGIDRGDEGEDNDAEQDPDTGGQAHCPDDLAPHLGSTSLRPTPLTVLT